MQSPLNNRARLIGGTALVAASVLMSGAASAQQSFPPGIYAFTPPRETCDIPPGYSTWDELPYCPESAPTPSGQAYFGGGTFLSNVCRGTAFTGGGCTDLRNFVLRQEDTPTEPDDDQYVVVDERQFTCEQDLTGDPAWVRDSFANCPAGIQVGDTITFDPAGKSATACYSHKQPIAGGQCYMGFDLEPPSNPTPPPPPAPPPPPPSELPPEAPELGGYLYIQAGPDGVTFKSAPSCQGARYHVWTENDVPAEVFSFNDEPAPAQRALCIPLEENVDRIRVTPGPDQVCGYPDENTEPTTHTINSTASAGADIAINWATGFRFTEAACNASYAYAPQELDYDWGGVAALLDDGATLGSFHADEDYSSVFYGFGSERIEPIGGMPVEIADLHIARYNMEIYADGDKVIFPLDPRDPESQPDPEDFYGWERPPNKAPLAQNDSAAVAAGSATFVQVLANDSDPNGDFLGLVSINAPTCGTAQIMGSAVYFRAPEQNCTARLAYRVSDGRGGEDVAQITVNVSGYVEGNEPPTAEDDAGTVQADAVKSFDVLSNDDDPDSAALSLVSVEGGEGCGEASIVDGEIQFRAGPADCSAALTYVAEDAEGIGAKATLSITVDNQPPSVVWNIYDVEADASYWLEVLSNDTDRENQPITIDDLSWVTRCGQIAISGDRVRFNAPQSNCTAKFTYRGRDTGGESDRAAVAVNVTGWNEPPVANYDSRSMQASSTASYNVLANDTDPDGDPLTIYHIDNHTPECGGSASFSGSSVTYRAEAADCTVRLRYRINDGKGGTDYAQMRFYVLNAAPVSKPHTYNQTGGETEYWSVLSGSSDREGQAITLASAEKTGGCGSVSRSGNRMRVVAPERDCNINARYTIRDEGGETASSNVTINVTYTPPNRAPVAANNTYPANGGTSRNLYALGNDSDPDGDSLSIAGVQKLSGCGSFSNQSSRLRYSAPSRNCSGRARYTISDGQGGTDTATITVNVSYTPPNQPPVANSDGWAVMAGRNGRKDVLANDTDPDGDPLEIVSVGALSDPFCGEVRRFTGGELSIDETPNYDCSATLNYTISDGQGGTDTAQVTVTIISKW